VEPFIIPLCVICVCVSWVVLVFLCVPCGSLSVGVRVVLGNAWAFTLN